MRLGLGHVQGVTVDAQDAPGWMRWCSLLANPPLLRLLIIVLPLVVVIIGGLVHHGLILARRFTRPTQPSGQVLTPGLQLRSSLTLSALEILPLLLGVVGWRGEVGGCTWAVDKLVREESRLQPSINRGFLLFSPLHMSQKCFNSAPSNRFKLISGYFNLRIVYSNDLFIVTLTFETPFVFFRLLDCLILLLDSFLRLGGLHSSVEEGIILLLFLLILERGVVEVVFI